MSGNLSKQQQELKNKRICRFCLMQVPEKLTSIYSRDAIHIKGKVPLPVQIMACVSIEVFSNDCMPIWVCSECRSLFDFNYRFKQMCKRAETLLRQYPLTSEWPAPLIKPTFPDELFALTATAKRRSAQTKTPTKTPTTTPTPTTTTLPTKPKKDQISPKKTVAISGTPIKILNSNPAPVPEPPVPVRMKKESFNEETEIFLTKVENNEELSMDDVHRLIASANDVDDDEMEFLKEEKPVVQKSSKQRPRLLNKSSIRILNKEADLSVEPRISQPQMTCDEKGNVAIVTEVLDPDVPYEEEPDPVKNAAPVQTNVFPCPHCERSFPLKQLRDIHIVNHSRERSFQCNECDRSFFSKYDLQKHTMVHSGDKPFKCVVCDKAFTRATLLHRHEKIHTDIPKYICIHCEKPFISKEEMEKHTERHLKTRPFQCKLCKKSFAFKQGLERHETVHARDQPYPCQYCDQSFSTSSKLARHLTAHAGERPYPCKFCSKSYLLSHHLTRHLRSHKSSTDNLQCMECKESFKTRDELIKHLTAHASQSLCCPLCKDKMDDQEMVWEHIRSHAEGDVYACEFCDLIFTTSERLKEHSESIHADDLIAYNENDKTKKQQSNNSNNLNELDEKAIFEEVLIEDNDELSDDMIKVEETNLAVTKQSVKSPNEVGNGAPASKFRKVYTKRTTAAESTVTSKEDTLARKVATIKSSPESQSLPTRPKVQIDIKENKIISPARNSAITTMLQSLPKSVSVRKSVPASATENKPKITVDAGGQQESLLNARKLPVAKESPEPTKRLLRTNTRRLNEAAATSPDADSEVKLLPTRRSVTNKVIEAVGSSGGKVVKMMMGDKKVKVHKITISRAEADAMTKDGRICIKDGNMILTQAQTPKSSK